MQNFDYQTPTRLIFGKDVGREVTRSDETFWQKDSFNLRRRQY